MINYIKKFFSLLIYMLENEIEYTAIKIQESHKRQCKEQYYIEAGKAIESIAEMYPSDYEDAVIIFEEWCKGLLSECRPSEDRLREYAKYSGTSESYRNWVSERNKLCKN